MGKLSIVATPIGNLEDITLRALRTLKECDVIYSEDTRVTAKLLARYEIKKADEIIARLEEDENIALVTDAGTPCISDPGARLVAHVREQLPEIKIEAIPGPSAITAALSIAGIDSCGFIFIGFLPHKKGRQTALKKIAENEMPTVLYESPHRILKLLKELENIHSSRVIIAREITKIHEEIISGTPDELIRHFNDCPDTIRGEFVVIVAP